MLRSRLAPALFCSLVASLSIAQEKPKAVPVKAEASSPAAPASPSKPVFETPSMTSKTTPRILEVDAPLKGAKELYLIVSDEGSLSCDWSDWLEPKLIMADGTTKDLTTLEWKAAKAGSGKTQINQNVMGGPLTVENKVYANGIGTHAASSIVYDLPPGVERFTAKVAIDDGGMVRLGKASDASVRFHVYTQKPSETQQGNLNAGPPFVPVELFTVPEGFEVTLWATSPLLFNPTNIDFDAQGRLYVAEGVNYRGKKGRRPEGDRIVVLEDTTGAGKADKSTVFVQDTNLEAPLGVAVLGEKVVVSMPPDLLVYSDLDHDGKYDSSIDQHEVLLTGFGGRQHDHSLHSLTAGPDGQWYFNQGNTGAEFTDKSEFLAEIRLVSLLAEFVVVGGEDAFSAHFLEGDAEAADAAKKVDEARRCGAVFRRVFAEDARFRPAVALPHPRVFRLCGLGGVFARRAWHSVVASFFKQKAKHEAVSSRAQIHSQPARITNPAKSCSVHGAACFRKPATMARMETSRSTRNENTRLEVTIEILRTKHEVFTAAAGEIARRAKVPVTAEAVMAFLLEAECDAKDIADIYCWQMFRWPVEWIDKAAR